MTEKGQTLFSIQNAFQTSWLKFKSNAGVLFALSGGSALFYVSARLLLGRVHVPLVNHPKYIWDTIPDLAWSLLLYSPITAVISMAYIRVSLRIVRDEKISRADFIPHPGVLLSAAITASLSLFGIYIATIFFILPGILLHLGIFFALWFVIDRKRYPIGAIWTARKTIDGSRWKLFVLVLPMYLTLVVLTSMFDSALSGFDGMPTEAAFVFSYLLLASFFILPFSYCYESISTAKDLLSKTSEIDELLANDPILLQGKNLSGMKLRHCQMPEANLTGANLEYTDLYGANLSKANLENAILRDAKLRSANLANTILVGADLKNADLFDAVLRKADLTAASLAGANLAGANLQGADLSGANLEGAVLQNTDLGEAILDNANLQAADMRGAIGAELKGTRGMPAYAPEIEEEEKTAEALPQAEDADAPEAADSEIDAAPKEDENDEPPPPVAPPPPPDF